MSRGFVASITGIAITILAWYGPWEWPAWPAFAIIRTVWGTHSAFADLAYTTRAAAVVCLIVANVAFWAFVVRGVLAVAMFLKERLVHGSGS
jgi:hypothetical protein